MRLVFSFVLFFLSSIQFFYSQSVDCSAFEGDPAGIVHNAVDTITGSYREHEIDAVIDAPQPIVLKRCYTSRRGIWQHFPECQLLFGKDDTGQYATISEANGTPIVYLVDIPKQPQELDLG